MSYNLDSDPNILYLYVNGYYVTKKQQRTMYFQTTLFSVLFNLRQEMGISKSVCPTEFQQTCDTEFQSKYSKYIGPTV